MAVEEKQLVVEETTVVPGKMEFRLISPTESNFLKHIEWNKEELLAAVRSKVALYEGIVYTEETVKTAKNDRAELNNLVKAIDERRKKVKEVINQPYAEFEKELKEITDLIKKQSAEIDEQVKAFETAEKEEKRAKIMEAYEKAVGNLAEILPFSKVFDQRYLNKTCKLESAIADVQKKIEQVKTDLETIESVCGKYKLNAMDVMQDLRKSFGNCKMPIDEFQSKLAELDAQYANGELTEKKYSKAVQDLTAKAYGAEGALKAKYLKQLKGDEKNESKKNDPDTRRGGRGRKSQGNSRKAETDHRKPENNDSVLSSNE